VSINMELMSVTLKHVIESVKDLPNYTVRIADDDDQPLPSNVLGNLLVRTGLPNAFFKRHRKCPDQILEAFAIPGALGDSTKMGSRLR
jgi:acyl-coenzyme A synthetase/AMP-(fatty) acid ligase